MSERRLLDVDDAVKDLLDVVFSVAEATLPVKSGLPSLKKSKNSRKKKNKWFEKTNYKSNLKMRSTALWKTDFEISL